MRHPCPDNPPLFQFVSNKEEIKNIRRRGIGEGLEVVSSLTSIFFAYS